MKPIKTSLVTILVLTSLVVSLPALAQGRHGHGGYYGGGFGLGVVMGASLFWPGYYAPYYGPNYVYPPYPYPGYYAPVAQPYQAPPAPAVQQETASYWYFCAESKTYYPYVQQCPGGWQRVAPTPPPG